jgi:hypothetical protein
VGNSPYEVSVTYVFNISSDVLRLTNSEQAHGRM